MFQIIASDLDGTLLNNAHLISEKTLQTIQKVEQQNITFSFATGRHHLDVLEIKKKFNLNSYMITSNGARIHDESNHLIYQKNLSTKVVFDILNYLNDKLDNQENLIIHLYTDSGWYMNKKASTFDNHYKISNFNYQLFDFKKPPTDNIFKLLVTSEDNDQETLNLIEKNLLKIFGQQCNIAFSTPTCLEIMDKEVSKGSALQYLAQKIKICSFLFYIIAI